MKNEKGSTLVTAIVITMVLMILLGACFSIASSYHTRSIKNHQEKQAYITAKSIVDTIELQINAHNNEFIPDAKGKTIDFPDIELTNDTCEVKKATITRPENNIIVIVATAKNFGRTQDIQLTLQKNNSGTWEKLQYSHKGDVVYETQQ